MKRRDFINSASSFLLPVMIDGLSFKAFSKNSVLINSLLETNAIYEDRVLVMIYMNGGNDGLNTVIPLDQMTKYNTLRSNIAIPENTILPLQGYSATGLHPAMTGMQQIFEEGKLSIVHSVSYPNPNLSHFRSTEILMTASDSNTLSTSGWAGRYLEDRFPNYPADYPNNIMEDPLAIQIGYLTSTALLGSQQTMATALKNPDEFAALIGEGSNTPPSDLPCCDAGELISFVRKQQILSIGYASEIKKAADAGSNLATYPTNNDLADQLKIVARLIHGGLKTKIYIVNQLGYDTHSGQVATTSTTGTHANLLKTLSDAIKAFQNDLYLQNSEEKVIGMTFSEFGRRANSNNSKGTDHGVAAPMFVFGKNIKQQMIGKNPNLDDLIWDGGISYDLKMQIDFRRIYRDILRDWFGVNELKVNALLYNNYSTISLFYDTVESVKTGNWTDPTTWSIGRVPNLNNKVLINSNHKITILSGERAECRYITINGVFFTAPGAIFKTSG